MTFLASLVALIAMFATILISDAYRKYRDDASDTRRTLEVEKLRQDVMKELERQHTDAAARQHLTDAPL